ncbi:uncharacterized protein C11orf98 isoform 2-T2 [Spinachia spinachia]
MYLFIIELGKNLFKRRRVLGREKRKRHLIVGAVVDRGLITVHHLKKRTASQRANITLSGKKKRKLIKQLQHMQRDKTASTAAEAAPTKKKQDTSDLTKEKKGAAGSVGDVEMTDGELDGDRDGARS